MYYFLRFLFFKNKQKRVSKARSFILNYNLSWTSNTNIKYVPVTEAEAPRSYQYTPFSATPVNLIGTVLHLDSYKMKV